MPTRKGSTSINKPIALTRIFHYTVVRQGSREVGKADVISRGVRVHQQPCHMLLGGSVMRTEMHGSCTGHRGSRFAPPLSRVGGDVTMRDVFNEMSLPKLSNLYLPFSV